MRERIFIENDYIGLLLLDKEDLMYWLENEETLGKRLGYEIENDILTDYLAMVFNRKITNMFDDPESEIWHSYFAIVFDNKIIGLIGPKGKPDEKNSIEIGYGINKKYWNKGIVTRSVKIIKEWYFNNTEVHSIRAETNSDNIPSQKVLEKNGFIKKEYTPDLIKWQLNK
jgi:ribosomal-protein-alanine N-acetyltransferase